MKLWFVVYIGSQIGGSVGPLPYDMDECLRRAAEKNAEWQAKLATGKDLYGSPVSDMAKAVHFGCVEADGRPTINYREGKPS